MTSRRSTTSALAATSRSPISGLGRTAKPNLQAPAVSVGLDEVGMQGGGLGAGVDLGLQGRQAQLGQRDPLLPTDDEARRIREHSGCLPDKLRPGVYVTHYCSVCTVGPLPRSGGRRCLKSAHFAAAHRSGADSTGVTIEGRPRSLREETCARRFCWCSRCRACCRSRAAPPAMPPNRPRPPPADAGPATEPDDPNAAPYPPDGVIDPNAEYPTDGAEGTDQGEAVPMRPADPAAGRRRRRRRSDDASGAMRH